MNINITPALRINGDFSVQALHTFKEGKRAGQSEWRDVSYHCNLREALASVVKGKLVQGAELARVAQTLARLNAACLAVNKACEGFINLREACNIEGRVFPPVFPDNFWSKNNGHR